MLPRRKVHLLVPQLFSACIEFPLPGIKPGRPLLGLACDLLSEDISEIESQTGRRLLDRIDIVRGQCERMEALLRDFLRYTRLRDIDLVSGSLNDQVEMVMRAYQAQADADQIDVEKYLDPDLPAKLNGDCYNSGCHSLNR